MTLKFQNTDFIKKVGKLFARFVKQLEPFRMISELAITVYDIYEAHNEVKLSLLKISK